MILIADSGSTKTSWTLLGRENNRDSCETAGYNPYYMDASILNRILAEDMPKHLKDAGVSHVYYYGSGCSTKKNCAKVSNELEKVFAGAKIEVSHDLLAAARALLGREEGIACILGTGANSCAYDGQKITHNVASLGYMFGDEGSGAYIGKRFLEAYLKGKLSSETNRAFRDTYNFTLEDILSRVYGVENPSTFMASFTRFLGDYRINEDIRELLISSLTDFFRESVSKYDRYNKVPVGFVGSVAFYFREFLEEAAKPFGIMIGKIEQAPMEGLIRYHLGE